MKIIQVLPFFLPDSVGGTEVYVWSLCKYLKGQGVEAEVLVPNYSKADFREYFYDGIKVTQYPEPTRITRLHTLGLALPEGLTYFRQYLQETKPDAVHFHGIYGGGSLTVEHLEVCAALGLSVYYTMHLAGDVCRTQTLVYKEQEACDGILRPVRCATCAMVYQHKPGWLAHLITMAGKGLQAAGIDAGLWNNPLGTGLSQVKRMYDLQHNLKRISACCTQVIVLTEWFKKILLLNGFPESRLTIIKQALPYAVGDITPHPVQFAYTNAIKLVFAGRIHPVKGVDLLLQALQDMPEEKIELSVYGREEDGEYVNYCRSLSAGKKNIHWRGVLPRGQVVHAFGQHDILCLPSAFSEMSPLVIQEAFAAGIPVLASDVYGNAEQIQHGINGLLFPFKSAAGIREQLDRVLTEHNLIESLKKQVQLPFTFDRTGEQYLEVYGA